MRNSSAVAALHTLRAAANGFHHPQIRLRGQFNLRKIVIAGSAGWNRLPLVSVREYSPRQIQQRRDRQGLGAV